MSKSLNDKMLSCFKRVGAFSVFLGTGLLLLFSESGNLLAQNSGNVLKFSPSRSYQVNATYQAYPDGPATNTSNRRETGIGNREIAPVRAPEIPPVAFSTSMVNADYSEPLASRSVEYTNANPIDTTIRYAPVPQEEMEVRNYSLRQLTAQEFEFALLEKMGKRCVSMSREQTANVPYVRYRLPGRDRTAVDLAVDRVENLVTISGARKNVNSTIMLTALLDQREDRTATVRTDLVPFQQINERAIRKMSDALKQQNSQFRPVNMTTPPQVVPAATQPLIASRAPSPQGTAPSGTAGSGTGNISQSTIDAARAAEAAVDMAEAAGLIGSVQVEIMADLDIVILRGPRKDVETVKRLIQRIEQTGLEQEPEVVLHYLKHADSYRVATMVTTLYSNVYLARRGTVSITAVVKPNAILLIGRKESVDTAKDLIDKLDVSVDPETQFKVLRLKNAVSDNIATYISNFYSSRTTTDGLSPEVIAISDYRTNSIILQASPRDMLEVISLVLKLDTSDGPETIVKTFQLRNAMAETLATTLQNALTGTSTGMTGMGTMGSGSVGQRNTELTIQSVDRNSGEIIRGGLMSSDTRITAHATNNSIVVTATPQMMSLIEELIKALDVLPNAESQMKVFNIVNGDASALVTMLRTIFNTATTTGGATTGAGATLAVTTQPLYTEDESSLVAVRLAVDVRTNSIVASGSPGDLLMIETLLSSLDEDDLDNRKVMVYRLLNSPADYVADALNTYITNERQVDRLTTDMRGVHELARREIIVTAETVSNSLIICAVPKKFEELRKIIRVLDDRPPMVSIDVLIADVNLTDSNEFGVELGLQDSILFGRGSGFGFGSGGPLPEGVYSPDKVAAQGITTLGVSRGAGSGFVFSASSESVSVLVQALEKKGRVQVLSRPQISTTHNQPAYIQVGEQVPFVSSVNTNYNSTTNPIEKEDVGLILSVTPRISQDGFIVMNIDAVKSKLGSEADGVVIGVQDGTALRQPKTEITKVQTTISAQSGQTVVLGGLISQNQEHVERGVPVLSKIPVLGNLFQYKSNNCSRSEMIIIMTPLVMRNKYDTDYHKQMEISRMHWCAADVARVTDASNIFRRSDHTGISGRMIIGSEIEGEVLPPEAIDFPATIPSMNPVLDENNLPIQPQNSYLRNRESELFLPSERPTVIHSDMRMPSPPGNTPRMAPTNPTN